MTGTTIATPCAGKEGKPPLRALVAQMAVRAYTVALVAVAAAASLQNHPYIHIARPRGVHSDGTTSTDATGRLARGGASVHTSQDSAMGYSGNGIAFHGGAVMTGPVNVYYIWYGNWSGNSAVRILTDFAGGLNGSAWWNIQTSYVSVCDCGS